MVKLAAAVVVDWIGGTTRVLETGGGSGVGIIVNEPMLLEVELRAGGVKTIGIVEIVGATDMLVGGASVLVGGTCMLVVGGVLVVKASVMSLPFPSHVCNSKTPRCAKSSTVSLVAVTSSHTMSTTCSTVLMPSLHVCEHRVPDAKSAVVHPANGVLYAILHIVGRTPFAIGWRSFRETADAVESRAAKAHDRDGCLRLVRLWLAILLFAFVCTDCPFGLLGEKIVIELHWIPSHEKGHRAMCHSDQERKIVISAASRAKRLCSSRRQTRIRSL